MFPERCLKIQFNSFLVRVHIDKEYIKNLNLHYYYSFIELCLGIVLHKTYRNFNIVLTCLLDARTVRCNKDVRFFELEMKGLLIFC
jgi:hypothetical protein